MSNPDLEYTRMVKAKVSDAIEEIKAFYCREDFEYKIEEVMEQFLRKPIGDAYPHRRKELEVMCSLRNVSADMLCDPKTRTDELSKIPTRNELCKLLIERLHDAYTKFPTSEKLMERLIRRLLKDEFRESDSVRLTILKKFIKDTNYHTKPIVDWFDSKYGDAPGYSKLMKDEKVNYILENLCDDVFENLNLEKTLENVAGEARRELRKAHNKKWQLLKLADDLATGKFRTNGATKEQLYIFAIAFDMTICLSGVDKMAEHSDLEKNLFNDFYNDNLLHQIQHDK